MELKSDQRTIASARKKSRASTNIFLLLPFLYLLLLGALALRGGQLHGGAVAFFAQLPPQLLEQLRLRGARVGEALRENGQLGVRVAHDLSEMKEERER